MADKQGFKIQGGSSLPMLLIFLALLFGFIFYFSVIKSGQVNKYEISTEVQTEMVKLRSFKNVMLNFSIFDRVEFRNLRIFGEVPVLPVPGGKTDLFAP